MMKIALAQVSGSPSPAENKELARTFAAEAAENGAELLIFPEMFMALPRKISPLSVIAEPIDGPFVSSLSELAQTYGLHLIAGVWEKIPEQERVINAAIMLSPEGKMLTVYRKLHLFDAFRIRESDHMSPGNALPIVIPVHDFQIGLAICYDLRFPELFRYLALQGADLIIVPAAWYAGTLKEDHWLTLLRARAIENTCYVAGVNLTGPVFCGRSVVFDPFGVVVADAGENVKLLVAQLDPERVKEVRTKLPILTHVRPEFFAVKK